MNILDTFKNKWIIEALDIHPGRDEKSIVNCFESFGVSPTKSLLALYQALDGKDCMDDEYFRLWSLEEIMKDNNNVDEIARTLKYGVMFADYCVNCWCYRINKNGEVLIDYFIEGKEPILRSNSLLDFFHLMLKDPDKALD